MAECNSEPATPTAYKTLDNKTTAGVVVASDGPEGSLINADNKAYAARIASRDASGRTAPGETQTPAPLLKHREVQSGGGSNADAECQASGADIADTYAALERRDEEDEDDPLLGSVLPSGGAVATGELAVLVGLWVVVGLEGSQLVLASSIHIRANAAPT